MSGFKFWETSQVSIDMHLKGNFLGCMRSNCKFSIFYLFILALFTKNHTSNVQCPIDFSRNKCTGGQTVPSLMSPCLPQWVVLSERETLFRAALDTTLKMRCNTNIYYILHQVQCQLFSLAEQK